jgi:hypothetical protein
LSSQIWLGSVDGAWHVEPIATLIDVSHRFQIA